MIEFVKRDFKPWFQFTIKFPVCHINHCPNLSQSEVTPMYHLCCKRKGGRCDPVFDVKHGTKDLDPVCHVNHERYVAINRRLEFLWQMLTRIGGNQKRYNSLSKILDKKYLDAVFLIAICRQSGDKWQSKTLFLTIFDPLSSIVSGDAAIEQTFGRNQNGRKLFRESMSGIFCLGELIN